MRTTIIPLDRTKNHALSMERIQLCQDDPPGFWLAANQQEICLYTLSGSVDVTLQWVSGRETPVHLSLSRRTVEEAGCSILRLAPCEHVLLCITLRSYAADLLYVAYEQLVAEHNEEQYLTQTVAHNHHVGTGTHERWVREVVTPPGYTIHCGETLNIPGAWSSWPSHATPEEVARHAEHEELFFVITPGYGLMHCDGKYPDGTPAPEVVKVRNGDAIRTPLGAHEIVFSPGDWGYYAWFYRSFLQKQYNKWATDGVKTYVK